MSYGYNPYGGYGVPAQQMYAQAPAQQMQAMGQQAQPNVVVRLVASREEATAALIQFDNTINVFINMAADEVYIKRFNPQTGGAWFGDYIPPGRVKQAAQEAAKAQPEYATVEMVAAIEGRLNELSEAVAARRGTRGAKTDE